MRIQLPGFACLSREIPAGRFVASFFGEQLVYFLSVATNAQGDDRQEIMVINLTAITHPQVPEFTQYSANAIGDRPTLLLSPEAFIKVDPDSIAPPRNGNTLGTISVGREAAFLSAHQLNVNLTAGVFGNLPPGEGVTFKRWALCIPDGNSLKELFTFGQP